MSESHFALNYAKYTNELLHNMPIRLSQVGTKCSG